MDESSQPQGDGKDRDGGGALPRETLVGVKNGDPEALSEFFEFCFDRVYSMAVRVLGDRMTAEDVTQEVFLKIRRAAGQLDPDRNPIPWVTAITYNACRDHWRSRGYRVAKESVSIDDIAEERGAADSSAADPETQVLKRERERRVQDALSRLPEDLRVVVVLRDYEGLRHEQIAKLVGASEAAVRKRYSRALAKLADELKGFWNE